MKIALHTLGCKVNYAETSRLQEQFEQLGYEITEFGKPADVILINTCSVTNNADTEAKKIIRRAKRSAPDSFLGVLGCFAQLKPEEVAKIEGVNAVFGQKEKFRIPMLLNNMLGLEKTQSEVSCIENLQFDEATTADNGSRTRAFMKLQDGCNYFCSFCTIPMARGDSRSMPFHLIEKQFEKVHNAGYKEVVISGINLGDYNVETGETFTDVVRLIDSFKFDLRVRISSIEPNLLTDEIIDIVANSKTFCPHFHIPLQSGSQEILMKMKRRYKKEYYRELIHNILDKIPHCGIGIDVIAGFPGETEERFAETYDFINELPASYLHAFTYSERDNTKAASMTGQIPVNIRKERTNILRGLSDKKKNEFYLSQIGSIRTVIPETYNSEDELWVGWTENYVRTKFVAPAETKLEKTNIMLLEQNNDVILSKLI